MRPPETRFDLVAPTSDPMFAVSLEGVVLEWNAGMAELLGIGPRAALGRKCWELVAGRTLDGVSFCREQCDVLRSARRGRSAGPIDVLASHPAGSAAPSARPVHLTLRHLVLMAEGSPRAVIHLAEDTAERRRREAIGQRLLDLIGEEQQAIQVALTDREAGVLRLLALGMSDREVAARLGIRHATARNHVRHILEKLGVSSRVAALVRVLVAAAATDSPSPGSAPPRRRRAGQSGRSRSPIVRPADGADASLPDR